MISDELGAKLHDRDTLGDVLSTEERSQLAEWYAQKDAEEAEFLQPPVLQLPNLAALQLQVDSTLAQLMIAIQRLQQITIENDFLRQEISDLKRQVATPKSA
jgi:hypothetical protein